MKKVFISYRWDDSKEMAGRICDRLAAVLPRKNVFFDVNTIKGGETIDQRITKAVTDSDVMLVLIGPDWLSATGSAGTSRLHEPDDRVRKEIRTALDLGKLVIPVLTDDTSMPNPKTLPDDIKPLTGKIALPLRHSRFDDDLDQITLQALGYKLSERAARRNGTMLRSLGYATAGGVAGSALAIAVALTHHAVLDRPLSVSIGAGATTFLLLAFILAGGAIGFMRSWKRPAEVPDLASDATAGLRPTGRL